MGGIHPALALVPIIPTLPHAARDSGFFEGTREGHASDPLNKYVFGFGEGEDGEIYVLTSENLSPDAETTTGEVFRIVAYDAGLAHTHDDVDPIDSSIEDGDEADFGTRWSLFHLRE